MLVSVGNCPPARGSSALMLFAACSATLKSIPDSKKRTPALFFIFWSFVISETLRPSARKRYLPEDRVKPGTGGTFSNNKHPSNDLLSGTTSSVVPPGSFHCLG